MGFIKFSKMYILIFFILLSKISHILIVAQSPVISEENDCNSPIMDELNNGNDFWAWAHQQKELFGEQGDGTVSAFLDDLEQEEQTMFPPPVIHPIAEKYTHKTGEVFNSSSSSSNDEDFNNNENAQNIIKPEKSLTRKLSDSFMKNFNKMLNIFDNNEAKNSGESLETKTEMERKMGEEEKLANLVQILRYDLTVLKRSVILGGQCVQKVIQMFSGCKQRLNLAIDLVVSQYGIGEIVPKKISLIDGTILRTLALKWVKIKKLKHNKNYEEKESENGEQDYRYVKEMLELIRGLLDSEQFTLSGTGSSSSAGRGKNQRRRRKRGVPVWVCIVACVLVALIMLALFFIVPNFIKFFKTRVSVQAPIKFKTKGGGGGSKAAGSKKAGSGSKKAA